MGAQIHLDGAGGDEGGVGWGGSCGAPAQPCLHPGYQLAGAKGLGDVVLGTQGEAHHLVGFLVLRREEDNGNVAHLSGAHAQLETIDAGHHDVHDGQIEGSACQHVEGGLPAIAGQSVHTLGHQQVHHQVGDGLLVVDNQYVGAFLHRSHGTRFACASQPENGRRSGASEKVKVPAGIVSICYGTRKRLLR